MRRSFARILAAAAAATFLFSSPAVARPASIRVLSAQEVHLAGIAYRMAVANAHVCPRREIMIGMVLHDLSRYDRGVRPAVSRAFSMNGGFGVLEVVPGSVAAEADLRVDDEVVAVGNFNFEDSAVVSRPKSYRRMEQFHALLHSAVEHDRVELVVRREGNLLRVPLRAQYGCGGKLTLTSSSSRNAWADGKQVVVTTGMANLARSDDEIAFVIAHEMAHNILEHSREDGGKRGIFGFSRIKRGEIEADSFAVRLMANAGYNPAGGISFLQNARRRLWWNVSLDHPGFGRRIETVAAAMRVPNRRAPNRSTALPSNCSGGASSSLVTLNALANHIRSARRPPGPVDRLVIRCDLRTPDDDGGVSSQLLHRGARFSSRKTF